MKPNFFVIAGRLCPILILLIGLNCSKDDTDTNNIPPPPPPPPADSTCNGCQLLYIGGRQQDAPTLESGTYEAAARFTPTKIGILVDKKIKEIRYFTALKPDSIKLKLYGPLDDKKPGDLLYSADVTSATDQYKWNVHTLTQDVTLKNEDLWLSVEFQLMSSRKTIGCDLGPALADGDWLYSAADAQWTPFVVRNGTSINWTIRLSVGL